MKTWKLRNLLVASLLGYVASFDPEEQRKHHVSTSLNILYPQDMYIKPRDEEQGYDHTDALFGVPFLKNRVVSGNLVYMTPEFSVSNRKFNGCDDYSFYLDATTAPESPIFLIDRGGCSFTDKTALAQENGASAVIFTNDECLASDIDKLKSAFSLTDKEIKALCCTLNTMNAASELCQTAGGTSEDMRRQAFPYLPFMVSAFSKNQALSINIPAMLVTFVDSLRFKNCLCLNDPKLKVTSICKKFEEKGNPLKSFREKAGKCQSPDGVVAELKLDTPHPDGEVHYELWMRPDTPPTLFKSFKWFSESLSHKTKFLPQYIVHQPIACANADETNDVCQQFCKKIDDDTLCFLPDSLNQNINGVAFLSEAVRQICVFNQGATQWWDYQSSFDACLDAESSAAFQSCSENVAKQIKKLDYSKWESCAKEDGKEYNEILKSLNERQQEMGVFSTCAVVNSRVMHFSLTSDEVAQRVCDGFAEDTVPHVCSCVQKALNEYEFGICEKCVASENCETVIDSEQRKRAGEDGVPQGGASKGSLVLVLLFLSGLVGLGFMYTNQTRWKMREEMRTMFQEYMPLDESVGGSHFERMLGSDSAPTSSHFRNDREDSNLI